jgi:hypothetical protein
MPKYTVPPYTPEDDASPAFDPGMIPASDIGGEKAVKAAVKKAYARATSKDTSFQMEKRVHGGTRLHQKGGGYIKGR